MLSHQELLIAIPQCLRDVSIEGRISGKVREMKNLSGGKRVIVTTDRISAFDVVLGTIPFKGQVLTQLSNWWFSKTADIVQNHVVSLPDPNVMVVREAKPLPLEIIVRGYITGVTKTSLWKLYEAGDRKPYGIALPDGLKKNDKLPEPVITPTTKAEQGGHDERITAAEIIERQVIPPELWYQVEQVAVALFRRGQELAAKQGLLLVDTKYEFGTIDGQLVLIDEVHTPDSSRYWIAETYSENPNAPKSLDKEFLREWFAERGYTGDGEIPAMPDDFIAQVAARYIGAFEQITGETFVPGDLPAEPRVQKVLEELR